MLPNDHMLPLCATVSVPQTIIQVKRALKQYGESAATSYVRDNRRYRTPVNSHMAQLHCIRFSEDGENSRFAFILAFSL